MATRSTRSNPPTTRRASSARPPEGQAKPAVLERGRSARAGTSASASRRAGAAKASSRAESRPARARADAASTTRRASADALALLTADHREVARLYREYQKLAERDEQSSARAELAQRICAALTVHAQIEEEIFYPAMREEADADDLLDEAEVEHESAKDLIAQIQGMSPDDAKFDARVTVLCEYVEHHVKEEEGELFKKARRARTLDLAELGRRLAARKAELEGRGSSEAGDESALLPHPPAPREGRTAPISVR